MSDKTNNLNSCSVIILAAGYSSRMEKPKFALQFDKNHTFLEKIIQIYDDFGCKEIIIVLNKKGRLIADHKQLKLRNARIVLNENPEWERFYSIKLGIQNLTKKHPVFIHNVDNPFVTSQILKALISQDVSTHYVVPTYNAKGGHPILISNKICEAIISEKNYDLILSDFLKRFKKMKVAMNDKNILVNINTEEVYQNFFE